MVRQRSAKSLYAGSIPTQASVSTIKYKYCPSDGMVDIEDLKSSDSNVVRVRVSPRAHKIKIEGLGHELLIRLQ